MTAVAVIGGFILLAVVYALTRVAGGLLAAEARGWLPHATTRIVDQAVHRLPPERRERWRDEWLADVACYSDRPLTACLYAIKIYRDARVLARELSSQHPQRVRGVGRARVAAAAAAVSPRARSWRAQASRQVGHFKNRVAAMWAVARPDRLARREITELKTLPRDSAQAVLELKSFLADAARGLALRDMPSLLRGSVNELRLVFTEALAEIGAVAREAALLLTLPLALLPRALSALGSRWTPVWLGLVMLTAQVIWVFGGLQVMALPIVLGGVLLLVHTWKSGGE